MNISPKDLINYDRYPIATSNPKRDAILVDVQKSLKDQGCAVLKGFLTPAGVTEAVEEADRVAHQGHRSFSRTNAYFTVDDPTLAPSLGESELVSRVAPSTLTYL